MAFVFCQVIAVMMVGNKRCILGNPHDPSCSSA